MRASEPAAEKYKKVCEDFPNLTILTKNAMPEKVQLTSLHATVGNNSLGESGVAFSPEGDLISPYVVSIKIDITFAADGDKIRIPITEVLLCAAAAADLTRSKKQQDWTPRNAVLLPPLLMEAATLNR